jgi:hypothetical protein
MLRGVYAAYGSRARARQHDAGGGCEDDDGAGFDEGADGEEEDYTGPHDLALLFMVFAGGALVQPGAEGDEAHRRQVAAEAEHLHQIARAALALQPVLEKPSLVTIQALHLLSIYTAMASHKGVEEDAETSMEMTWSLITLAAHLSQTIGLRKWFFSLLFFSCGAHVFFLWVIDRDSARWGLSETMVQRRRILFWDLFVADVWQVCTFASLSSRRNTDHSPTES